MMQLIGDPTRFEVPSFFFPRSITRSSCSGPGVRREMCDGIEPVDHQVPSGRCSGDFLGFVGYRIISRIKCSHLLVLFPGPSFLHSSHLPLVQLLPSLPVPLSPSCTSRSL
ncbi:Uncharacterized protein APZ42_024798 [Daphnia magna]|uniref:Uncharacterized protein n=1 Tax=Daphnia magna TaxID=35525 RepID=A0A164TRE3_9CRUS|nr:Uncharacterized protein APZ42_024798 [Daphnia magna]